MQLMFSGMSPTKMFLLTYPHNYFNYELVLHIKHGLRVTAIGNPRLFWFHWRSHGKTWLEVRILVTWPGPSIHSSPVLSFLPGAICLIDPHLTLFASIDLHCSNRTQSTSSDSTVHRCSCMVHHDHELCIATIARSGSLNSKHLNALHILH